MLTWCSWAQVNLGVVKERLEAHPMTVFTESDVRYELGASFISAAYAALPTELNRCNRSVR